MRVFALFTDVSQLFGFCSSVSYICVHPEGLIAHSTCLVNSYLLKKSCLCLKKKTWLLPMLCDCGLMGRECTLSSRECMWNAHLFYKARISCWDLFVHLYPEVCLWMYLSACPGRKFMVWTKAYKPIFKPGKIYPLQVKWMEIRVEKSKDYKLKWKQYWSLFYL